MTEQWKPIGDKWPQPAMVWVYEQDSDLMAIGRAHEVVAVAQRWVSISALHPMPPNITPEQQAVLDAAMDWGDSRHKWGDPTDKVTRSGWLLTALEALRKSQQPPPTPLQTLRAAWDAIQHHGYGDGFVAQMEAAIVALEKKA